MSMLELNVINGRCTRCGQAVNTTDGFCKCMTVQPPSPVFPPPSVSLSPGPTPHKCPVCSGTGHRAAPPYACRACSGTGVVWSPT